MRLRARHAALLVAATLFATGCTGILHEQRFVPDVERGEASVVERRDHLRRMAGAVIRLSGRTGALILELGDVRLGLATERVRSGVYAFGPILPFIPFPVNDDTRETLAVLLQLDSETPVTIHPDATRIRLDGESRWTRPTAISNGFQFDRDVEPLHNDGNAPIPIEPGERLWLHFDVDPRDPDGFAMDLTLGDESHEETRAVSLRFTKNRATFFVVVG